MNYLNTSNGLNSTVNADGSISLDVSEAWVTESVRVDKSVNSVGYTFLEDGSITDSSTITYQVSVDGVNFQDLPNTWTATGGMVDVFQDKDNFVGYYRFKCNGNASAGTITISYVRD